MRDGTFATCDRETLAGCVGKVGEYIRRANLYDITYITELSTYVYDLGYVVTSHES